MENNSKVSTLVVKREGTGLGEPANTVDAKTPQDWKNITLVALSPMRITLTRVARVYVQSFIGMLTVLMSGIASDSLIAPKDFGDKVWLALGFAIAPSVVTLGQNLLELLVKLDETHPELRG